MRIGALAILGLLAIAAAPAAGNTTVTVTFEADASNTFPFSEPGFAVSCSVTVPTGSTAADVLDQAVADGCISSWDFQQFDFGRFVTEVNGTHGCNTNVAPLEPAGLSWIGVLTVWSWWEFQVNGESSPVGIDDHVVSAGETIGFVYNVEISLAGPFPNQSTGSIPGVLPCMFQ